MVDLLVSIVVTHETPEKDDVDSLYSVIFFGKIILTCQVGTKGPADPPAQFFQPG